MSKIVFLEKETPKTSFRVVGESIPRIDAVDKVTGEAVYFTDFKLPGMLHGKILRSPIPHGRILNVDVSRARAIPGVKAIITVEETPRVKYGVMIDDQLILASDKVRFVGDEVAAVAAISEEIAEEAVEAIKVDYEELPSVFDPEEAMEDGAPLVHDAERNVAAGSDIVRGDVDVLFEQADYIFEDTFYTSQVNPSYLEPYVCVARWQGQKLDLWIPTQSPFLTRSFVAKALQIPLSTIRVIHHLEIGGAFGGKLDSKLPAISSILAKRSGKPVRISNTREEELSGSSYMRCSVKIDLKTAVKKDGLLLAKKADVIGDNGAYSIHAPKILCTNMAIRSDNLYRFKGVRTRTRLVYTNKIPTGAFRGYGNPQMHFATESQLDMIADRLGIDPIELRLKNAVRTGDVTVHGWEITSGGFPACLETASKAANWRKKRTKRQKCRGTGVACAIHVSGNRGSQDYHGAEALVRIQEDGKVQVVCAEQDMGQGARTVLCQIAAEELGVSVEQMEWVRVDTDTAPFAFGAYSSRTTHIGGNAVRVAAQECKKKVLALASEMMSVPPEMLAIQDGRIGHVGENGDFTGKALTLADVARAHIFTKGGNTIIGHGSWDPDTVLLGPDKYGNISTGYLFATQIAEVEVDPETGQVTVLEFIASHDLGRVINPIAAEGQIEGGVAQGLGYALLEEIQYDGGKVTNPNFLDYKIPVFHDMPSIHSILVESNEPQGPFGAKGLAEATIIPVAPAIANAVCDAVGIRLKSLPLKAQDLLSSMRERGIKKSV